MAKEIVQADLARIRALLDEVLGHSDYSDVQRMGGLTNRTYCVSFADGSRIMVRIPGEGTAEITLPYEVAPKPSAERRQSVTGISRTRLAPHSMAAFARTARSKIAGAPRWTKSPLMTHTTAASCPSASRVSRIWRRWPL